MEIKEELFYKNLKTLREKSGLTQEDAASAAGVNIRTYQRYESGEASPSEKKKALLANAFKTSLAHFYQDDSASESINESRAELLTSLYSVAPTLAEDELREVVELALRHSR